MKTAAIIVGHSRVSQGAANPHCGTTEFEYNEPLAQLIADQLQKCGSVRPVIIYRDSYKTLSSKVNETGADIAIELHCNAHNTEVSGTEMLHWHTSQNGKRLAQELQNAAVTTLGLPDRGVKPIDADDRGGYLLRHTSMPCVIVESFFIDNDDDLAIGIEKRQALAVRYARAIEGYFR